MGADLDLDGFGSDSATTIFQCEDPSTSTVYVGNQLDCDDNDVNINPNAVEVCDPLNIDENCDGLADDDDPNIDSHNRRLGTPTQTAMVSAMTPTP